MLGKDHLVILQSAYQSAFDDHRALFATLLARLRLPAPGVLPREPVLSGAFDLAIPPGWDTGSYMDDEVLIFENRNVQGSFKLMRHSNSESPASRSDWYFPKGTVAQPVLMLGQPALLYELSKRSKTYQDAKDSDEITRLYIFESCLPDGDALSIELTGLPSFYDGFGARQLIDSIAVHLGADAAPCPASSLPQGAVTGAARKGRRQDSGLTLYVSPSPDPEGWQPHEYDTLRLALPSTWTSTGTQNGNAAFMSSRGEYELILGHTTSLPAARPNRAEMWLADGTRFLRQKEVDGESLISLAPAGALGHLVIFAKGGSLDGPGFEDIWPTLRVSVPAVASAPTDTAAAPTEPALSAAGSGTALGGLLGYRAVEGFVTEASLDLLTYWAEDGRGFFSVGMGNAVLPPNGFASLIPPGRFGSFESGFFMEWTGFGWPSSAPEFMEGSDLVKGWHFLNFARNCGPEQVPVAIMYGGTSRFTGGDSIDRIKRALTFNWPAQMEPCQPPNAGVSDPSGKQAAEVLAPSPQAPTPQPSTPQPGPGAAAQPAQTAQTLAQPKQPAPKATQAVPPPPPPTAPPPPPQPEPDLFVDQGGGYGLYQNARYGTVISYPSGYFAAAAPPGSGDGRSFVSADGQSKFYVFAQYNALGLTKKEMIADDKSGGGYTDVTYEKSGDGWYVLSGHVGQSIFYRKVLLAPDDLVQVFEISYPTALKAEFDAVVTHMAASFGPMPGPQVAAPTKPQPPTPASAAIFTPARNTALRAGLMDAARVPIQVEIGRKVIFVVSVLNSDGKWAYLQAEPRNLDGSKINWSTTPFAREMRIGVMSDVAMVLMQNTGSGWRVVDHVMGPTDVYWYGWLDRYGLSEKLFTK